MKLRKFLLLQELIGLTGGQLRLPGEGTMEKALCQG
jgi:hypothetical protein